MAEISQILQRYYYKHLGTKLTRSETAVLGGGDSTPGGASDALLLEDGVSGFQLEDASGVLLME